MKKAAKLAIGAGVVVVIVFLWFRTAIIPEVREFKEPTLTPWKPEGPRKAQKKNKAIGITNTFHTLHADTRNSDEVLVAVSPKLELDWVAEENLFIVEGPTIDNKGNLYASPLQPVDDLALISLDGMTGKRRWAIERKSAGAGAPLILDDPDHKGEQIIYLGLYERAMAIRTDGTIIWEVMTGFKAPDKIKKGDRDPRHNFGLNYHPKADAILSLHVDGKMYALDRKTGKNLLEKSFELPGAPAAPSQKQRPAEFIVKRADSALTKIFGPIPSTGEGRFSVLLDALFGGGFKVSNYYGIDPNTSRMFVAGTALDEEDGKKDGISNSGALYALEMVQTDTGKYNIEIIKFVTFAGGTGSSPAISADGKRIYTSDNFGVIICYDFNLNEIWRLDVGEQIAASITVASENNELYAISLKTVFKLVESENSAKVVWKSKLDMYPEKFRQENYNLLTATIAANGISVQVGAGYRTNIPIPLKVGVGLLDRQTGELRSYTEGGEESVSVTVVAPDGSILVGHSPFRRAVSQVLFGWTAMEPITGGISKFKPVRLDLLIRDALHAASTRSANASILSVNHASSIAVDITQIKVLMQQSLNALPKAVKNGDVSEEQSRKISTLIRRSEESLKLKDLKAVAGFMSQVSDIVK